VEVETMKRAIHPAIVVLGLAGVSLALVSCARPDNRLAMNRPAPRQSAPPATAALQSGARGNEAVWSVRAGLNVAALSCRGRGRQPVAGDYAKMLARHRALLDTVYRQEQARQGARAFDRQQTRIYNIFANQASPARFCGAASSVAHRANGLDSAAFALAAPHMLGELKASLH
jgi:hypothetical protein